MSLANTLLFLAAAAPGVLSTAITTITPCPANPTLAAPITVTEQYETVSTCGVSVSCNKWKSCTTTYPFTTSVFVSTTIPCSWNGTAASSTIVTTTDQIVTGSVASTTLSTVSAVETFGWGAKWGWASESTSYTTQYETRVKEWDAPYETLGPIAVSGWEGSGLCTDCEEGDVKIQTWNLLLRLVLTTSLSRNLLLPPLSQSPHMAANLRLSPWLQARAGMPLSPDHAVHQRPTAPPLPPPLALLLQQSCQKA
ncbi:hypothetical protein EDD37DRAFT_211878 [Exophiala viscosa]|uniref:uncharacterized protein n=1 Tax=Exophiala viscosa TaxID=2486360 RepID=UPI0021A075A6|nr:hypothetical protein EDD37DRAFT_211878 [Exophiala viscosa]